MALAISKRRSTSSLRDTSPTSLRNFRRSFGEWTPQEFEFPKFNACPHALSDIKPPMYRPFRWGKYHVTMGIRSMSWGEWIELDDQYEAYHHIRKDRIECKGAEVVKVLPLSVRVHEGEDGSVRIGGGAEGAIELVHELAEYLSRRYPTTFSISRHDPSTLLSRQYPAGWDGAPPVKSVRIVPLQEQFELPLPLPVDIISGKEKPDIGKEGEEAMRIAALLIQDDLAIMVEGSNGGYYFQAGAICVAGSWRMKDKLGMRLDEIHLSGDVPQYQEKLHVSLERFFRRISVDKPVVRNNYFVQISPSRPKNSVDPDELAWGETVFGSEDSFGASKASSSGDPPDLIVSAQTLRLRTERQTLRRLPRSGAVVFTIRTYLVPLEELAQEPGVAKRFASALRSWPDGVREYKGERRYGETILQYLDAMATRDLTEDSKKAYPF
ncbi:hypothetical protein C8J57DRAFT_1056607 [Mycena rebaudengoi]|nr:hypothetical protein C8J57DRAFT_1056607 [Mycena rebaudengoi]